MRSSPPRPEYVQKQLLRKVDEISLDREKIYLTFYFSDGDSLNWICRGAHGGRWRDRGQIPMGWEIQPLLLDLAPGILDYFYKTATEKDVLIGSASGVGYNHPENFSPARLREYLLMSQPYYERLDLNLLVVLTAPESRTGGVLQETIDIYDDVLGATLLGVFESYTALERAPIVCNQFVWMPTRLPYSDIPRRKPARAYEDLVKTITETASRPLFVPFHVNKGHMSYQDAVAMTKKLESEFPGQVRITAPDKFLRLYCAWAATAGCSATGSVGTCKGPLTTHVNDPS